MTLEWIIMLKAFLRSKEFLWWLAVNAVLPILLIFLIDGIEFQTRVYLGWALAASVLIANATLAIKFNDFRKIFIWTIVLNLISTVAIGSFTIVTAIPEIPFLVESLYLMMSS